MPWDLTLTQSDFNYGFKQFVTLMLRLIYSFSSLNTGEELQNDYVNPFYLIRPFLRLLGSVH